MSELGRWSETCADADVARLLRAGRPSHALKPIERERTRQRVIALEAARPGRRFLAAFPAAAGVLFWGQHAALGAVLGALLAAAARSPSVAHFFSIPTVQRMPSARPLVVGTPPTALVRATPQAPTPELSRSRRILPIPSAAVRPALISTVAAFERELALLERARRELQLDPAAALRLLDVHRAEFSSGPLSVEREFLAVAALVRIGRADEARARAAALRARVPGNLYADRLERLLGDLPGSK